jgi:thiol-disulfide isomerase/thioredoxin
VRRSRTTFLSVTIRILIMLAPLAAFGSLPATAAESTAMENFYVFESPPDANDLMMKTPDGRNIKLSDFQGKVVLLNFWRQNCRYCHREKGYLNSLKEAIKSDKLVVICVDFWDEPKWVMSYAKENPGHMLFAMKPDGTEPAIENMVKGRLLGYFIVNDEKEAIYEVKGFPSTYVISKDGKVLAAHLGMGTWNDPNVVEWLTHLVAVGTAPYSSAEEYRELPSWLDRLLGGGTEEQSAIQGEGTSSKETIGLRR